MLKIKDTLFRAWYWYVSNKDKNQDILFMNYGYSDPLDAVSLRLEDEKNRYSIQLYRYLAKEVAIENKEVVEIGCGRGGGLSYVNRNYHPKSAVGIDLNSHAIKFCSGYYDQPTLSFKKGSALDIPAENCSCDVVFNVESSHRYLDMDRFLLEASRILRPGGYLLLTDFRFDHEMAELTEVVEKSEMAIVKEEIITEKVVNALDADDQRKKDLVCRMAPKILRKIALNFAGTVGSQTYNRFAERKYIYFGYVFQKQS